MAEFRVCAVSSKSPTQPGYGLLRSWPFLSKSRKSTLMSICDKKNAATTVLWRVSKKAHQSPQCSFSFPVRHSTTNTAGLASRRASCVNTSPTLPKRRKPKTTDLLYMGSTTTSTITNHPTVYESPQKPTHQSRTRHHRIGVPLATSDPKFYRGAARRRFTYTVQLQRTGAISRCKYAMVGSGR